MGRDTFARYIQYSIFNIQYSYGRYIQIAFKILLLDKRFYVIIFLISWEWFIHLDHTTKRANNRPTTAYIYKITI